MSTLFPPIIIALYLGAALLLFRRLKAESDSSKLNTLRWAGLGLAAIAAIGHMQILYRDIFTDSGLNLSLFIALSLVAWLISLMVTLSSLWRPVENLGIITYPLVALFLLILMAAPTAEISTISVHGGLKFHIAISIVSYSLLSIAAAQAVLLYLQERHLRQRHLGGLLSHLPPLETMESLLFQMITTGYILLTLSLLSGAGYLEDMFKQHMVHKTFLSIIAWGVFAVLLWGRWKFGWRGRSAIHWTFAGFFVLASAYFGSKLVLELFITG